MLDRIVCDYNKLRKKEYRFILQDGTTISLKFKSCNLPHLIGLAKLKDDDTTITDFDEGRISAKRIIQALKNEDKTYLTLKSYPSWTGHLTRRMENFTFENLNMLIRQSAVINFIYDPNETKNDKAKFIFYTELEAIHLHLYIGEDENGNYYYPNSFNAEFKKDSRCGKAKKIKVTKVLLLDGSHSYEIEHDKIKSLIREVRVYGREYNRLMNDYKGEKGDTYIRICEIEDILKESYEAIDKYMPLEDFFRIKSNGKLEKLYKRLKANTDALEEAAS